MSKDLPTSTASSIYDDFTLLKVEVDTLAKLKLSEQVDEQTGEVLLTPHLDHSNIKSRLKKTDIILAPDGSVVYPQSLYLVSKLSGEGKVKDTGTIAKALLAFTRYLDSTHYEQVDENGDVIPPEYLTYKTLSKYEEEGAPWRFAEFLLANTRHRNSAGNEAFALSTARSYMNSVICFYKWLAKYGYIHNDEYHVVTHYKQKSTGYHNKINQHDILAHTKSNKPKTVDVSNIMDMFPKADSTPAHKKLKPMTTGHQALFDEHVGRLPKPFSLMFRLSEKAGLRIDELALFPANEIGGIDTTGLDVVPIRITETKGAKPRVIEIPVDLYEELEIYKENNKQRLNNISKRNKLIESKEIEGGIEYLFLSNKGTTYSDNTIEKHFNDLRKHIIAIDPTWYYRAHDLRSTFATNWLRDEAAYRKVGYDFLMGELADLMGHADTSMTEKYVKFMNEEVSQRSAAKRKNNKFNGGW
ncbi:tyrosine-type recombinase/integrase [Vibrio parahaemolyticus]|uniref:tyrosine-type recombinase/integrase n=1 Tax=Vibrio parahaemolyticus TaxID=670 RepID=UPI00387B772D|nr:site-specific integrase [Vibrio parahaemolyticus]